MRGLSSGSVELVNEQPTAIYIDDVNQSNQPFREHRQLSIRRPSACRSAIHYDPPGALAKG